MRNIQELKKERAALWEQTKKFLEGKQDPKTGLVSAENVAQYDRMVSQIKSLGSQIKIQEEQQALDDEIFKDTYGLKSVQPDEKTAEAVADNNVSATSSKAYSSAFSDMLRGHRSNEIQNALSVGTDSEGGYTVPDEFDKRLVRSIEDHNVIRSLATTIHTESGMHKLPVAAGVAGVSWIDEAAPVPEIEANFNRINFSAYKLGAMLKCTQEFLQETSIDVTDYVIDSFGIGIGQEEERAFINGTGVKQPTGLLHDTEGAQIGTVTENADRVTFDDVIRLYYSLKSGYRKNAVFLCNEDLLLNLMLLKDGIGNYLYKPSLEIGKPDTLLGKPIFTTNAMPELLAGNKVLLFGALDYYWIADRGHRTLRRLNELFSLKEQVGFMTTERLDGKLILPEAVKVLKLAE